MAGQSQRMVAYSTNGYGRVLKGTSLTPPPTHENHIFGASPHVHSKLFFAIASSICTAMAFFHHTTNINASFSRFTNIGRDQYNIQINRGFSDYRTINFLL
jgi:hypothetical protein